jgi:hypothetical protein
MLQRVTFSTVSFADLKKAGVLRGRLIFAPAKITNLTDKVTTDTKAQIADLHCRIKDIYACVNMDVRVNLITFVFWSKSLLACSMNQVHA